MTLIPVETAVVTNPTGSSLNLHFSSCIAVRILSVVCVSHAFKSSYSRRTTEEQLVGGLKVASTIKTYAAAAAAAGTTT